ncbi:MAG TPA: Mur ligase family protein [Gemmatimonadota bacterium]|nr:Mur ligase family protein [Gemmatimonadota bacterium]
MIGYADTLAALARLERFGVRLGLENMRASCAALGAPERAAPVLHVGGTNGKGTTAEALAGLAAAHGLAAGLYTSPHLVDLRERIRVAGRPAAAEAVAAAWRRIAPEVERRRMTYFEATTLIAFLVFEAAGVDVAVVEVGLGGRLDATNVVHPELAVVTNVGRDHERHLGTEPAAIAREKAGIFTPGRPALVGDPGPPEVRAAFRDVATQVVAPLEFMTDVVKLDVKSVTRAGTRFDWAGPGIDRPDLEIPLAGAPFAADAALALRAWDRFAADRGIEVEESAVRESLAALAPPGRVEWLDAGGAPALLDVAHNPEAVEGLAATLAALGGGPSAFVVGILADKAWEAMLDALEPAASRAWLCGLATAPADRRLEEGAAARGVAMRPWVEWAGSVAGGLAAARGEVAAGRAERIVVTGSFYTVGEALIALGVARPGEPWLSRRRMAGAGAGAGR